MQVTSPDLSVFDFQVLYDLSEATPSVKITNKSVGTALAGTDIVFELFSSSGIAYHSGNWSAADAKGDFTTWFAPVAMLQLLGHIEWSGAPFVVKGYLKDSTGKVFTVEKETVICRPPGNAKGQGDNYGAGKLDVKVLCEAARIQVEDITNYSYQGMAGVLDKKSLRLNYPMDKTGTAPTPFTISNYNGVRIPIWFSSRNYQLLQDTYMLYHFSNETSVKLRYRYNKYFNVLCNVDLCQLSCEISKLVHALYENGCTQEERDRLMLANAWITQAMIAKIQPTCGADAALLVEKIQQLLGLSLPCGAGDGIAQLSTTPYEGYKPNGSSDLPNSLNASIQ